MSIERVRSLWDAIQARAWSEVPSHFSETASMTWPVTGEQFRGRDGIVAVNEHYPEGWSIQVLAVDPLADGRIVSRVKVKQAPNEFFAVSFYTLKDDLITDIEEYWVTKEDPEPWRNAELIPGWRRT